MGGVYAGFSFRFTGGELEAMHEKVTRVFLQRRMAFAKNVFQLINQLTLRGAIVKQKLVVVQKMNLQELSAVSG